MLTKVQSAVRRTRQHHAIEHATLTMLAGRYPGRRMAGYSDPGGFTIFGDLTQEQVRRGVADALLRLQAGQRELAIHPNCGTNLAATGVLVALAALLGNAIAGRSVLNRFGAAVMLVLPALVVAQPLGHHLQHYTTLAAVGDRWVRNIRRLDVPGVVAHRVEFE
jgi:hypothetical protein